MGLFILLSRVASRLSAIARGMPEPGNGAGAEGAVLRTSPALQEAVFASAPEAILILDARGHVVTLNLAAETLLGYRGVDAVHFDVARLLSLGGNPAASAVERLIALAAGKSAQEAAGWHRDGTVIPIEAVATEMPGQGSAFALFLRDLRERRRSEQMKSEFVATVSHELRTPLTSISGSLGLLASGAGGSLPDPALRLIRIAHANSQRLARLVNDLLDIEKIESGALRFDIRAVPVKPLIQQAIEHTRPFADGFDVTVLLDPDLPTASPTPIRTGCRRSSPIFFPMRSSFLRPAGKWMFRSRCATMMCASACATTAKGFRRIFATASSRNSRKPIAAMRGTRAAPASA